MYRIVPDVETLDQHLALLYNDPELYRPAACPAFGLAHPWAQCQPVTDQSAWLIAELLRLIGQRWDANRASQIRRYLDGHRPPRTPTLLDFEHRPPSDPPSCPPRREADARSTFSLSAGQSLLPHLI